MRGRSDFVNVRDPILHISLPEFLLGGRRQAVNRALIRELHECVCGLCKLGGRVFGRQRRCFIGMGLHVSTHSALSQGSPNIHIDLFSAG